jgi:hypothetical protein
MGAVRAMLIVISMVLMTNQVSAQASDYHAMGVGVAVSCGAWVERRKTQSGAAVEQAWVLGYVSASNATIVAMGQNDVLAGVDVPAISAWLDNYCRQHPLEKLAKATDALVSELIRKAAGAETKTK